MDGTFEQRGRLNENWNKIDFYSESERENLYFAECDEESDLEKLALTGYIESKRTK